MKQAEEGGRGRHDNGGPWFNGEAVAPHAHDDRPGGYMDVWIFIHEYVWQRAIWRRLGLRVSGHFMAVAAVAVAADFGDPDDDVAADFGDPDDDGIPF